MKVLVTGANGFVGRALVSRLAGTPGIQVVGSVRSGGEAGAAHGASNAKSIAVPEGLTAGTDWSVALRGVDVVVHTAARVHVLHEQGDAPLLEYRRVNVEGTVRLAQQAKTAGARRFVFVSSIKVNGEATAPGRAFTPNDIPAPTDPYGLSKWEAEQALWKLTRGSAMDLVVIRPPLLYGAGVKANFAALLRVAQRGWPLPLGAIDYRRSFLGLDNLVDFVAACIGHQQAANQTFLVSDGHDLSTPELVRAMARASNVQARLLPVPVWALRSCGALVGRSALVQRLCGNLQLDISSTARILAWSPPISVEEGLRRLAAASRAP